MITKFTIDRAKWRRGRLMDNDGCRCAMGHFLSACGVKDEVLKQWKSPIIAAAKGNLRTNLPIFHAQVHLINDNEKLSDSRREHLLRERFSRYGVKLHFTGKYAN